MEARRGDVRLAPEEVRDAMPLASDVIERCRPLLPHGEEICYIFPALGTVVPTGAPASHFVVAVTETKVTVLYAGMARRTKPQSVWAQYPRTTRIGPVDADAVEPAVKLGDLVLAVDEEYIPVIAAADFEITAPDFPPPHLLSE
jgi:hypothetical protein